MNWNRCYDNVSICRLNDFNPLRTKICVILKIFEMYIYMIGIYIECIHKTVFLIYVVFKPPLLFWFFFSSRVTIFFVLLNLPHLLTQPHSPRSAIHNNNAGSFSTMFTWDLQNSKIMSTLCCFYSISSSNTFASLHWHMSKLPWFSTWVEVKMFCIERRLIVMMFVITAFGMEVQEIPFICSC